MRLTSHLLGGFTSTHPKFIARTVIVKNGDVDGAFRVLNKILSSEGILDIYRRTRTYEKPYQVRRRANWENAKAVYDEDMNRKIKFLMRANRVNPWVGVID